MTTAYVALGSNLGDPATQLSSALRALRQLPDSTLADCSPWYRSRAVGPGEQPDYLNAVARLETALAAVDLLRALQAIEAAQGRQRELRWGPRTIDLDILLYGESVIDSPELCVPHPRLKERNFVLFPLFDLAPELALPCGTRIESLLQYCSRDGLSRAEQTPTRDQET